MGHAATHVDPTLVSVVAAMSPRYRPVTSTDRCLRRCLREHVRFSYPCLAVRLDVAARRGAARAALVAVECPPKLLHRLCNGSQSFDQYQRLIDSLGTGEYRGHSEITERPMTSHTFLAAAGALGLVVLGARVSPWTPSARFASAFPTRPFSTSAGALPRRAGPTRRLSPISRR